TERLQNVIEHQKQVKSDYLGYDRHCRHLGPDEIEARLKEKLPYTVRFIMPLDGETTVKDYIRGEIHFDNRRLQDAVLMKSDGYPTYHFANVIDDHLMEISHILRGDEWVNSLPLHIRLYQALGWSPPVMAHLPVILNPSGKGKMSKRENRAPDGTIRPVFVRQYQEAGYIPEALVNFMALVGWSLDDHQESFTRNELIKHFTLENVHKSPAVWNYDKLNQFNSQVIRGLRDEELSQALMPFLSKAGLAVNQQVLLRVIPLIRERITLLSEGPQWVDFYFQEPKSYDPTLLIPKKESPESTLEILKLSRTVLEQVSFTHETLYNSLKAEALEHKKKPGPFFQPLRVAVCGKTVAPPLFESLEILGRPTVMNRIDRAIELLTPLCKSNEESNG
ncbi:MAG: glutamate--tRNA ligase, partial [FCB group bacterium]|nr:glutamate--tRNA ligase [FCB group bacterium]